MGLYKELDYHFAELAKRQTQVYPDACDAGIVVETHMSPVAVDLHNLFNPTTKEQHEDHDFLIGGLQMHRSTFNYGASFGSQIVMYLPWEQHGPKNCACTKWTVRYTDDKQRKVRFISLDAERVVAKNNDIWKPHHEKGI